MLGVNSDEDVDRYRSDAAHFGVDWPNVWDGSRFGPVHRQYGVRLWPMTYLIDRGGVVREVWAGSVLESTVEVAVQRWLGS